jgi:hypothetical protein
MIKSMSTKSGKLYWLLALGFAAVLLHQFSTLNPAWINLSAGIGLMFLAGVYLRALALQVIWNG